MISPIVSKRAEVNEDDIDDVATVAEGGAELRRNTRAIVAAVSVVETDSTSPPMTVPMPAPMSAIADAHQRRRQGAEVPEVPEHQHVNDHSQRLDGELRHRQIGRPEQQERQGHAVADDTERQDCRHRRLGQRRGNRSGDDDDNDQDLVEPNLGTRREAKAR